MSPKILIISGSSGSGKSTLVSALQESLLPTVWLNFSFDTVIYSLPSSVLERCNSHNDWAGVDGKALFNGAIYSLKSLVDTGNLVMFDVVLSNDIQVKALETALAGIEVRSLHLTAKWSVIEERTKGRADRTLEEAERSHNSSIPYASKSIILDTSDQSPNELVEAVSQSLKH